MFRNINSDSQMDIINGLSNDLKLYLTDFMDTDTVISAGSVNRQWHTFFANSLCWKFRIQKDFAISSTIFIEFEKIANLENVNYRLIYSRLFALQHQTNLPRYLSCILRDETYHKALLACCTDDITVLGKFIGVEDYAFWQQVSLYADCALIPLVFYPEKTTSIDHEFLKEAAKAGNLYVVKEIISEQNGYDLLPTIDTMRAAIQSRNKHLVNFLFQCNEAAKGDHFNLNEINVDTLFTLRDLDFIVKILDQTKNLPTCKALISAIELKDEKLVNYFQPNNPLKYFNRLQVIDACLDAGNLVMLNTYLTKMSNGRLLNKLHKAIKSGHVEIVKFFHEKFPVLFQTKLLENMFKLALISGSRETVNFFLETKFVAHQNPFVINQELLPAAAHSGCLSFFKFILTLDKTVKPNLLTLHKAIFSGNYKFIFFLLDRRNNFDIKPDLDTLNLFAARYGLDTLVRFLLDPKNNFNLTPNQITLEEAVRSGNLELVRFLLNPKNNFNLVANDHIMNTARVLADMSPYVFSYLESRNADELQRGDNDLSALSLSFYP